MGVIDAAAAAIRGVLDWSSAYGTVDWLQERVNAAKLPDAEVHGNGLFVKKHMAPGSREELEKRVAEAREHLDAANQICCEILEALP